MKKNKNLKINFTNFWQGKLSLKISFWFVLFLGGGLLSLPTFLITDAYVDAISETLTALLLIYLLFYYIYLIIAYVGTWKSASNFKRKKNQWAWGTIAKVYIVLNILNGINQLIFQ